MSTFIDKNGIIRESNGRFGNKPGSTPGFDLEDAPEQEQIERDLYDEDVRVRSYAARNPSATEAQLDKALDDEDVRVRSYAARNPSATEANLAKALDDKDAVVRRYAAWNPSLTEANLAKALDDEDEVVRAAAAENPSATEANLVKALDDEEEFVREGVAGNPSASEARAKELARTRSKRVKAERRLLRRVEQHERRADRIGSFMGEGRALRAGNRVLKAKKELKKYEKPAGQ